MFIVISPWLIKNFILTGNPVYPFLYKYIPSKNIHAEKIAHQMREFKEYTKRTVKEFLVQPWTLTFSSPNNNSYMGTTFLFLLPGFLVLLFKWGRASPIVKVLLGIVVLGSVFWTFKTQIIRYYIPIFSCLVILSAYILSLVDLQAKRIGYLIRGVVLFFLFWGAVITMNIMIYRWDPVGVSLGLENKSTYLNRKLMNSYTSHAEIINQLPLASKVLLVGETRSFYFEKPVTAATVFDYDYFLKYIIESKHSEEVWEKLSQAGYTHIYFHFKEATRIRHYEPYLWDKAALERLQTLFSFYLDRLHGDRYRALYVIKEKPDLTRPMKLGRPLFTYPKPTINKVIKHYSLAWQAFYQAEYLDAEVSWQRILKLAPDWYIPYMDLALLYLKKEQYTKALNKYEQAERLWWLDEIAYNNLGSLYRGQGDLIKAKYYFEQALIRSPNMELAKKNLQSLEKK